MNPDSPSTSFQKLNLAWSAFNGYIREASKSEFGARVKETFFNKILLITMGVISSVLITRSLGPEGRGHFAMAVIISTMSIQLSNLGLHGSNTYYVSRDRNLLPALLINTLWASIICGGAACLAAGAFCFLFPEYAPIRGWLLFWALLWIPFGLANLLMHNLLLGIDKVSAYNRIELVAKVFYVVIIGLFILSSWVSPITIFSCVWMATLLSLAWSLKELKFPAYISKKPSYELFKRTLRYGLKSFLGSLVSFLLFRIDIVMINQMMGAKNAGFYDIAYGLAEMVNLLPQVVATLLFPKLCSIPNIQDKWNTTKVVGLGLFGLMAVIVPLAILFGKPLLIFLYGEPFEASTEPFIVLAFGKLLFCMAFMLANFIGSIHVPVFLTIYSLCLIPVNIALNLYFIEAWGLVGAATASILAYSLLIPVYIFYCNKYLKSSPEPAS